MFSQKFQPALKPKFNNKMKEFGLLVLLSLLLLYVNTNCNQHEV